MSVPVTLITLFAGLSSKPQDAFTDISSLGSLLPAILILISLAGFGVFLYVVNLRMDVILYARTINAIRKRFYDEAPIDLDVKLRTRVLPQTASQPAYMEHMYFLPVVLTFALFNSFYLFWAFTVIKRQELGAITLGTIPWWSWLAIGFILVHYCAYRTYAARREHTYLKSYAVGIDIDGVLNLHREHFCNMLSQKAKIDLHPSDITAIPLHDCMALGVSSEDEKAVFNDARYWIEMPPAGDAAENLKRLRSLKLAVHIFSHRPWPNPSKMEPVAREALEKDWRTRAQAQLSDPNARGFGAMKHKLTQLRLAIWIAEESRDRAEWYRLDERLKAGGRWVRARLGIRPIEQFTRLWLRSCQIGFDELTIEQGNEDVADPQGHFRNRFYMARQKGFRFFVEDDLDKAIKIASICDVVFLLDHPYNSGTNEKCQKCQRECKQEKRYIPDNLKRVKSWEEIYKYIRRVL